MSAFRLWSIFRQYNTVYLGGSGAIPRKEAQKALSIFNLSQKILKEAVHLANNGSVFFSYSRKTKTFYLNGLESVCLSLQTVPGNPIEIAHGKVSGHVGRFKGALYVSGFRKGRRVSRATLEKEYGIPKASQLRYEAKNGTEVSYSYNKVSTKVFEGDSIPVVPEDAPYVFEIDVFDEDTEEFNTVYRRPDHERIYKDFHPYIIYQGPNYYEQAIDCLPLGMSRKVARTVRKSLNTGKAQFGRKWNFIDSRYEANISKFGKRKVDRSLIDYGEHPFIESDETFAAISSCGKDMTGKVFMHTPVHDNQVPSVSFAGLNPDPDLSPFVDGQYMDRSGGIVSE